MGLFSKISGGSKTCPTVPGEDTQYDKGTSHRTLFYLTSACAAVTFLICIALIIQHLRRYRVPKEQRQIVKITLVPVVYAAVSVGTLADYHVAPYIVVIGEWYGAWCLAALFLLFTQFAAPGADFGDNMFNSMLRAVETAQKDDKASWPKIAWASVFQYPVVDLISIIVLEATTANGTYCASSLLPKFGHLWATILSSVSVIVAVMAVLKFYNRMKKQMKIRRAIWKLAVFKGIIALTFIQTWLFSILIDRKALKPSASLSYGDLLYGIPNTLLAVEMLIFSAGYWYAYSSTEYSTSAKRDRQPMNFLLAFFDALNPSDLFMGVLRAPAVFFAGRAQDAEDQYGLQAYTSYAPVSNYGNGSAPYEREVDAEEDSDMFASTRQPHHSAAPAYDDSEYQNRSRLLEKPPRSANSPSPARYHRY